MLRFKFSEVRTVRQAMKAFNRIEPTGEDRKRQTGRGRALKAEKAFASLIRAGKVQVIRRKFKPPLIRILEQ